MELDQSLETEISKDATENNGFFYENTFKNKKEELNYEINYDAGYNHQANRLLNDLVDTLDSNFFQKIKSKMHSNYNQNENFQKIIVHELNCSEDSYDLDSKEVYQRIDFDNLPKWHKKMVIILNCVKNYRKSVNVLFKDVG